MCHDTSHLVSVCCKEVEEMIPREGAMSHGELTWEEADWTTVRQRWKEERKEGRKVNLL